MKENLIRLDLKNLKRGNTYTCVEDGEFKSQAVIQNNYDSKFNFHKDYLYCRIKSSQDSKIVKLGILTNNDQMLV